MSKLMAKLEERMKEVFLKRDVIIHFDGECWWAHDCLNEEDSIIFKHRDFEKLIEGVDEWFIKNPPRKKAQHYSEGN